MAEVGKLQEGSAAVGLLLPWHGTACRFCVSIPALGVEPWQSQACRGCAGCAVLCGVTWPLSPQPPELEQLGRVVELDSDMADITQEPAQEALAEDLAEEQEAVPASTHIASTQGINPYVLQVSVCCPPLSWRGLGKGGSTSQGCISLPEGVYSL